MHKATVSSEQYVYDQICQALYGRRLSPGSALTERVVCDTLQVGRTAVRGAFRKLEEDGYVERVPNRGAFIITGTREMLQDYYQVRTELILIALRQCIGKFNKTDFLYLEGVVKKEEIAYNTRNFKEYLDCVGDFFGYIVAKPGSAALSQLFSYLYGRQRILLLLYDQFGRDHLHSLQAHTNVIELLRKKDLPGIEKELNNQISQFISQMQFATFTAADAGIALSNDK